MEQVHDVIVSNCSFGSNAAESVGFLSINMPFDLVIIRDCIYLPTTTSPVVAVQSLSTAGTLELRNLKVMRNADGNAAPAFISLQNCTINKLVLDISVEDLVGSSYTPLPTVITASGAFGSGSGSTISHLVIERIGTLHITQLFDSTFGPAFTVTSVEGSGVLNTGWEIPDANMGNNSPYISSTEAGDVSIKISGVPYAFQFSSGVAPLAFNLLSSGVNLSAAMVLGSGASLTASGGGSISANELNGALVPASSAVLGSNSLGQLTNNSASFPSLTGTNLHTGANTFSGVVTGAGFTATGAAPLLIPNSTFIEALTSGGGAAAIIGVSGGAGNALLVGSPAATGTGGVHLYASGTDALDVTSLGVFSNVPLTAPNINQVLYAEFFLGLTGAVLSTTGAITPSTGLYRISTQVRVVGGATAGTVVLTANWTDSHAVEGITMANVSLVNASNTFQSIMVIANGGTALKFNTTCAATGSYSYDLAVMFELIPAVA